MRQLVRIYFGAALLLASVCIPLRVSAESIEGLDLVTQSNKSALAVSPAIIEQVLTPEQPKAYKLMVSNLTNFPLPISSTVKNFVSLEDIADAHKRKLYDASKWFTIQDPDFILQPKQIREVTVTINPPKDSEPGGHYATVYFQPLLPEGALTPSTAYLSARVGSLAFLIMPGDFDEKLTIKKFSVPALHQSGPVPFTAQLENTGSVHESPNSKVVVRNWLGKKINEAQLNPGVILPGTTKEYNGSWEKPSGFGKYSAVVESTYGADNTKVVSKTNTFWILPLPTIALLIVIAGIVVVGFRTKGRWGQAWNILRGIDADK